jgi:hypothetical protein
MARTIVKSDTFTDGSAPRDLTTYDAKWINTYISNAALETDTNGHIYSVYGNDATYYYNDTFSDDQYSEVEFNSTPEGNNVYAGVILRSSADINANRDYYVCYFWGWDSPIVVYIAKVTNGSGRSTALATSGTTSFANGDKLSADVVGNTISVYKNATGSGDTPLVQYTDSSSPFTTGFPGIFIASNSTPRITKWEGGNITGGGASRVHLLAGKLGFPLTGKM